MGAAYFYHLTRQPVEEALPLLLDRALAQGWRVAVRGQAARLDRLDRLLWTVPPNGFLPHGLAGGQHDARQPILLGGPVPEANDPACLMSLDGAEITPDEVRRSDRACILFDGHDPAALDRALIVSARRDGDRAALGPDCIDRGLQGRIAAPVF